MARGGARARSGPAPDPDALRRDRKDDAGWVTLPAEGWGGPTPDWPLQEFQSDFEGELWAQAWQKPQAKEWSRLGLEMEVALYVRAVISAADPEAPQQARTNARQLMDSLGLTVAGMRSHRWKLDSAPAGDPTPTSKPTQPRKSARDRFTVHDGGQGAA